MIVKDLVNSNEIKLSTELNIDMENVGNDGRVNHEFVGDFEDRIKMRKKMINRVLTHYENNDENMYDECLEMCINMEEDLVT